MKSKLLVIILIMALMSLCLAQEEAKKEAKSENTQEQEQQQQMKVPILEPEIKEIDEFYLIGMRYSGEDMQQGIPALWVKFSQRMGEIPGVIDSVSAYGVSVMPEEATGPEDFEYTAAMKVSSLDEIPEGMVGVTIPTGRYAIFTHEGSMEKLQQTYGFIYGVWAKSGDYTIRDAPEFEVYGPEFNAQGGDDSKFKIYVPIE